MTLVLPRGNFSRLMYVITNKLVSSLIMGSFKLKVGVLVENEASPTLSLGEMTQTKAKAPSAPSFGGNAPGARQRRQRKREEIGGGG
jgi:hypothetical protein